MESLGDFRSVLDKCGSRAFETERIVRRTKPYERPSKNYMKTYMEFSMAKMQTQQKAKSGDVELKLNTVTCPRHCCVKSIDELEPIRLSEMMVNMHHKGKYLLCRTIVDPMYMTALTTLIEDENGEIEILSLYNCSPSYDIDPADLYPANTVLMIKEPYLKIMIHDNKDFYIRVESPTDLVILDNEECGVPKWSVILDEPTFSFNDLVRLGNNVLAAKEYRIAIKRFTQALKVETVTFF